MTDTQGRWRPLSVREGRALDAYDGPSEGVPSWLFGPLWSWVVNRYPTHYDRGMFGSTIPDPQPLLSSIADYRRIAMALRISIEDARQPDPADAVGLQSRLYQRLLETPDLLLDVADHWLATVNFKEPMRNHDLGRDRLDALLAEGPSVYHVLKGSSPPTWRVGFQPRRSYLQIVL